MQSYTYGTVRQKDPEAQNESSCLKTSNKWLWRLAIDIPLLTLVLALVVLFELGVLPHHKNGFYCNDPALSHKFTGDSVSMQFLVFTILILPMALIFIAECILQNSFSTRLFESPTKTMLHIYRSYIYGLFFNLCVIEVMKGLVGNPRPTFFDICEPDKAKTCNGSEYVSSYECTSTRFSKWFQSDSYHSFPSGHTSLSIYGGLFMAWYLQRRAFDWNHRTYCVVPVLQLVCLSYAAASSLTRITDHRHHWWDVLTGAVIGVLCAVHAALVLCENFKTSPHLKNNLMTESQQTVQSVVYDNTQINIS
ncbi:putative phosphatidate phosphatase isoform X3 [Leptidea sinapis]|uniref:putative phosphatidate phosphatase isoform X3 n=1 Tax=Leptidea sinapis TaxID=189913 RepID=UPI002139806C|nr:putative phosphatidate phosphatase isoform X3 [Leptidea sinapis]